MVKNKLSQYPIQKYYLATSHKQIPHTYFTYESQTKLN